MTTAAMISEEELYLHQYNFSNWMPSSIRTMAVDKYSNLLAVGRQDGEIEFMEPNHKWYIQGKISGKSDIDISGLVFSSSEEESGRLFGSTLQGYLFEVDFASLTLKNIRDSYGGTVWALAVCKRSPTLGVGCEDGTVKLFSFANAQLDYLKSMSATGSRILSVAFHPVEARVYAGCADGTIRCYNETTGSNIFRIVGDVQKGQMCSIWSLTVLRDFTLISGDNHGRIQFWNGYTGNELLSTTQVHTSTISCLATNDNDDAVFASGEDSRVICLRKVNRAQDSLPTSLFPSSELKRYPFLESMINCQWIYTNSHRPHTHDVRSLVIVTQSGKSVLVSGGVDSKLCMYSVDDFTGTRPTWILPIPARGVTSASNDSKLLTIKHRTHLDIWSLNYPNVTTTGAARTLDKTSIGCSLSCRIQLKDGIGRDCFHSISLSSDGELLAATGGGAHEADCLDALCGLRIWHLERSDSTKGDIVAVKVQLSSEIMELFVEDVTCQTLAFNSDGSSLCVTICGTDSVKLVLLDIEKRHQASVRYQVSVRHVINHSKHLKARREQNKSQTNITEKLSLSISSLAYSSDGQWLGVCSCDRLIFIYEIDRFSLHWEVPAFHSPVSCIAFHPQSPNSLITVLSGDNSFQIFNVQEKALSPWSLENQKLIPSWTSSLGKAASGPVMNISFDPTCLSAFVMHGQAFSIYVNLDRAIPTAEISNPFNSKSLHFTPQAVTEMSLASAHPPNRVDFLQKELNDLVPTDRKYLKKRKKLQKLLEEEEMKQRNAPASAEIENASKRSKKSRKIEEQEVVNGHSVPTMRNFSILKSHRSIVHLAILNSHEMVVVENPWVRVLENLPETLARKRYGGA